MKQTELKGYVARNGTDKLIFFTEKPYRTRESLLSDEELEKEREGFSYKSRVHYPRMWCNPSWTSKEISFTKLPFDESIFSDLKWEDEPIEVTLICRIEK